jgi:hypothetical protein
MIFGVVGAGGSAGGSGLAGQVEVVQAGNSAHGVVDTVALQAAVAKDLPALHAGEDVLDAGPYLFGPGVLAQTPAAK